MKLGTLFTSTAVLAALVTASPLLGDEVSVAASTTQQAATPALTVKKAQILYSADGRRIGRVNSVVGDSAAPEAIRLIYKSRMIEVPASTLSAGDKKSRIVTSLNSDEIG